MYQDKVANIYKIGERVDKLREQYNLSKTQLSEICGVSTSYMSRLINGNAYWNDEQVATLADYFDVSMNYLKYGENMIEEIENNGVGIEKQVTELLIHIRKEPINVQMEQIAKMLKYIQEVVLDCS